MESSKEVLSEVSAETRALIIFNRWRAQINTALPAIVRQVNRNTVDVTLAVERVLTNGGALPPIEVEEVSIVYPTSGGWSVAFPISPGDSGMVIFQQRDVDTWLASGEVTVPATSRLHDYSDAVFVPGLRTDSDAPPVPDALELRGPAGVGVRVAEDGAVTLSAGSAELSLTPSGTVSLKGSTVDVTGSGAVSVKGASASLAGGGGAVSAGPGGAPVIGAAGGAPGGDLTSLLAALADLLASTVVPSGSSAGPLSSQGAAAALAAKIKGLQG